MKVKILGSGQDGGIPQSNCYCRNCNMARKSAKYRRFSPSIAILSNEKTYFIDASPDFKYQLDMVEKRDFIDGIFLTHAHMGHYLGLLQLGKEVMNTKNLPVFCTKKMKHFLSNNKPFSYLIHENNIKINEIYPDKELDLSFKIIPIEVPHRNEITDTVGYIINRNIIYLPDLDYWTGELIEKIKEVDIALIDGCFYSKEELPRFKDIPHPPIKESINLLENINTKIYFTHINHTNPVNREGEEKEYVESKGFKVANDGLIIEI